MKIESALFFKVPRRGELKFIQIPMCMVDYLRVDAGDRLGLYLMPGESLLCEFAFSKHDAAYFVGEPITLEPGMEYMLRYKEQQCASTPPSQSSA